MTDEKKLHYNDFKQTLALRRDIFNSPDGTVSVLLSDEGAASEWKPCV
jgi:hypothetical protein